MVTINVSNIEFRYIVDVLRKHCFINGIENHVHINEIDIDLIYHGGDVIRTHNISIYEVLEMAIINNLLIDEIAKICERFKILNDNLKYIDEL